MRSAQFPVPRIHRGPSVLPQEAAPGRAGASSSWGGKGCTVPSGEVLEAVSLHLGEALLLQGLPAYLHQLQQEGEQEAVFTVT